MRPRVVASIEARMGSSRLPGKVLAEVGGEPVLAKIVRRLRRARAIDDVVLATTTEARDDVLAGWAASTGIACHRGSEDDVLGRVVGAHSQMGSELVVELTADGPFLDPEILDLGVETFLANEVDVVANVRHLSFPQGIDVQVFRLAALEEVARTIGDPAVREHVSLHFYEHPERYRILHLVAPRRWHAPELRLLLDYPDDLRFVREIHARLGDESGLDEILALLRREPSLVEINRHCQERPPR